MSVWPELANRRYGEYPKGKYRDDPNRSNIYIDADFTVVEEKPLIGMGNYYETNEEKPLIPEYEWPEVKGTVGKQSKGD